MTAQTLGSLPPGASGVVSGFVRDDDFTQRLMQLGLLMRTPRGRLLSETGYRHLGLQIPKGQKQQLDLLASSGQADET